jgi:Fe-S-cluster containining protein
VLFGDVELRRGDDARVLKQAGVPVEPKGRKQAFAQPCVCLVKGLCRIYEQRPTQCRAFECRQVQRVRAGELSVSRAQQHIRSARTRAEEVLRLLRELGQTDESLPLSRRYALLMAEPIDFSSGEAQVERRGELMLAVAALVERLERDFLV